MQRWILIGAFGFIGTIVRYAAQGGAQRLLGSGFPYGTLAVNVVGSFVVGLAATLFFERMSVSPMWRSAVLIGFCGGSPRSPLSRTRPSSWSGPAIPGAGS